MDVEKIETPEEEIPENEKNEIPETEESGQTIVEDGDVTHEDLLEALIFNISDRFDELIETRQQEQEEYMTLFESKSGHIAVRHEITLGDLILATLLASILILQIISKVIRRF